MRLLLACTCLTPISLYAGAVQAERTIATKETAAVATATASNGGPDSVRITSAGTLNPSGGTAVTINSSHNVTNEGAILITGANDATGILASPGLAATITNSGTITINEDFTGTDADNDGDVDGPFAQGARRFGIRIAPGGAFTGNVVHSGTITIEGNDSAGILLESRLEGSLVSRSVAVVGDRSYGVRAGEVTGNVRLTGSIAAAGAGSVGVALDGNIGGALSIQGTISSTGYRSPTPPADTSKLDTDDLLQGGSALRIAGNVAGGILFDRPPADANPNDADEDDDGIPDAEEGTASVASAGAAPAVQIGAADRSVTVGAVAGETNGHGLVINGTITGSGAYKGVDGNGLVIGGLGAPVTIAGGMTLRGTITASSADSNATGMRLGNGASLPEIRNSGRISASGATLAGTQARALFIDTGAAISTIRNAGQITATAGAEGGAAAIVDRSGGLSLIENSGRIEAAGAAAGSGRNVAMDLAANTSGVIIRQTAVAQGATAPTIAGDILLGTGDDLLDLADGAVTGTARFGAGANRLQMSGDATYSGGAIFGAGADRVTLAGTSSFTGSADFGGGGDTLDISGTAAFRAAITNSAGLAANVQGGSFAATNAGTVALSSLAMSGNAVLGVNVDAAAGTNTLYDVAGAATLATGTGVRITLAGVGDSEGRYVFLRAGTLTGGAGAALTDASLPFLFKGRLDAATANELAVVVERRTATELGLNGSEGRAYEAVFDALDSDEDVADAFLAIDSAERFRASIRQMLPEHAGGAFDTVTQGSRATARFLADPHAPLADMGGWGLWLQQVAWGSSKDLGDTAAYDIAGWGTSAGAEVPMGGLGRLGASLAYLNGEDSDGETDNQVRAKQYELAAYWRGQWGGLRGWARGSAALVDFTGSRTFTGTEAGGDVTRTAQGDWGGRLYSAALGLSYEVAIGRLALRPTASLDYYRLSENGYAETGGGDAFNLTVEDRTSDELAVNATLTAGYEFSRREPGAGWLRTELEAGRRQIVGGTLGTTTARFADGDPFVLVPEARTDGWIGRLRVIGGQDAFSLAGEISAEEQLGRAAVAARVSLRFGL